MDFYDSKAAVDAMAALQARIREMERGNAKLRKECARLRTLTDKDEVSLRDRENSLLEAADRAKQMLDGASETLSQLRVIRKENRTLKKQLEELESELEKKIQADEKAKATVKELSEKKQNSLKLIREYEELFKKILSPPNYKFDTENLLPFNNTAASTTTHSLPATLQTVVQLLQGLPFPFRDQKLDKKREIINILSSARDIAERIAAEIRELEATGQSEGYSRRVKSEIAVKASHFALITQAMSRFRFE